MAHLTAKIVCGNGAAAIYDDLIDDRLLLALERLWPQEYMRPHGQGARSFRRGDPGFREFVDRSPWKQFEDGLPDLYSLVGEVGERVRVEGVSWGFGEFTTSGNSTPQPLPAGYLFGAYIFMPEPGAPWRREWGGGVDICTTGGPASGAVPWGEVEIVGTAEYRRNRCVLANNRALAGVRPVFCPQGLSARAVVVLWKR